MGPDKQRVAQRDRLDELAKQKAARKGQPGRANQAKGGMRRSVWVSRAELRLAKGGRPARRCTGPSKDRPKEEDQPGGATHEGALARVELGMWPGQVGFSTYSPPGLGFVDSTSFS